MPSASQESALRKLPKAVSEKCPGNLHSESFSTLANLLLISLIKQEPSDEFRWELIRHQI